MIGPVTATVSFIRHSRMFHPRGEVFTASVSGTGPLALPPHVLVRFSSAWWKRVEWVDVLGIALRFSDSIIFPVRPDPRDQDLLFATIRHPWTLPFAPFSTNFRSFLDNLYYAVSPFSVAGYEGKRFEFKLNPSPSESHVDDRSRSERLNRAVAQGTVRLSLYWREISPAASGWSEIAVLEKFQPVELDQEALRFNPFQAGRGIHPRGLIHHLRIGAYRFGQRARQR